MYELLKFYIARNGCANGFLYKDWADFTTAADGRSAPSHTDQALGVGDGAKTQFRLVKRYVEGAQTVLRNLMNPVDNETLDGVLVLTKVGLANVNQTSGFTVDTTTGIVTFSTAPGVAVSVTGGCQFDVPCDFSKEIDEALMASIDSFDERNVPSIPIVERITGGGPDEDFNYGHGSEQTFSAALTINPAMGRAIRLVPSADMDVILPAVALYPPGTEHPLLWNDSAFDIDVKYNNSTLLVLGADQKTELFIALVGGTPAWKLFGP